MRLSHLIFIVMLSALLLTIGKDPVGRVALVVFTIGVGVFVSGLTAIMALFQTVGAIGYARAIGEYLFAIAATLVVLIIGSVTMAALLGLGIILVDLVAG